MATVNKVGGRDPVKARQNLLGGKYRQLSFLSAGAKGEVFLVEDAARGDRFALKLLPAGHAPGQLRAEFARLTEISHPNIVRVHDAGFFSDGVGPDRPFLVTDYLAGPSLAEDIGASPPEQRFERFAIAAEALADALAYLHGRGILHGDISPANVRCDESGRPFLIDFGLAERLPPSGLVGNQPVAGTMGFIAPESLLGERSPATDVFALGATLYDAWAGAPPFGLGFEAVKRAWQGPPPPPSSLQPGLPPAWDAILLSMLSSSPHARPGSARELHQALLREIPGRTVEVESDLSPPFPTGDPFAGILVGRAEEMASLRRHFERLAEGAAVSSLVCVVGAAGIGKHALIHHALREARLAVLSQTLDAFDIEETETSALAERVVKEAGRLEGGFQADPASNAQAGLALVVEALEQRASKRPLCLALAGSVEDELLAHAVVGNPPSGRLLVLLPRERACWEQAGPEQSVSGGEVTILTLRPLPREAIGEIARRSAGIEAARDILDHITNASAGLPGVALLLIRRWIEAVRKGMPQTPTMFESISGIDALLDESLAALSEPAREVVLAAALSPAGADEGGAARKQIPTEQTDEGIAEACTAGWLEPVTCSLPSEAHAAALWRAVAHDARLRPLAESGARHLLPGDVRIAEVRLALGDRAGAAATFWQATRAAEHKMAWSKVASLGMRARLAAPDKCTAADSLTLATALGILGRYQDGIEVLDTCAAAGAPDERARLAERKAWLLGRMGDPESARHLLEETLSGMSPANESGLLLRARLARILVATGNHAQALAAARPALGSRSVAGLAARESAVLALAYGNELADAEKHLSQLRADVMREPEPTLVPRTDALEGLVRQLKGKPREAVDAYRRAVEGYDRVRDPHGRAAATFNLGCSFAELGEYGNAIVQLERAVRELGRLGAVTDHALAVFNVGQLLLQLGDYDAAARALARLRADVGTSRLDVLEGHALLLTADLHRRRGLRQEAEDSYERAAERFSVAGLAALAGTARLGRAELMSARGALVDARALLGEVERIVASGRDTPLAESLRLTRARLVLADPNAADAEAAELGREVLQLAEATSSLGRLPVAWRALSLAARLSERTGDGRQAALKERSRRIFEEVKMNTPAKYWNGLLDDDARSFTSQHGPDSQDAVSRMERAVVLEGHLRRLLRINKRLNSDLRLSRVLETIIDTVIELTDAERGFLLLKDNAGELQVKVARNIDQTTLEGPGLSLSRTIAKRAADTGEPVITVDAAEDSRFSEQLSVSDLHLRSVLAAPLAVKGTVVGTIYVDHRLRKGVFGQDAVAMVLDFAQQGAIAIENARIISELRRREQQVQALNRRLERELRVQEAALSAARVELKESRHASALRYDYRHIVGQSPAMLDLFRLLDRVTDTNLPVVIEGESGTGKELVARAIHFHGPRKDKAFVSENCAAIPETLLESALFGHVRGAFTGADRDARGLFSVANGGTLFLDEVADMSPAMQGKLLRVLQDGEFHRVGSERPERVDVRVVVASNRDLGQMVEEGRFRKDLFYRLSVVRLRLPPLRERREDIPLLLRHFLDRHAQQEQAAPKQVEPAALAHLCGYAWPGNVRELENEVTRAAAFSGARISVSDLSSHVQNGQDPVESIRNEADSLRMRQRVERMEKQLIREAMTRSHGNQTKAATLLGLSRFGLQKKLRRYNLGV